MSFWSSEPAELCALRCACGPYLGFLELQTIASQFVCEMSCAQILDHTQHNGLLRPGTTNTTSGWHTGAGISQETAAGNDPSSLGSPPPVTAQGPDTPVPGEASFKSLPTRAISPASTAGAGNTNTAGR